MTMILNDFWQDVWEGIKKFFQSIANFFLAENDYGLSVLTRVLIAIIVLVVGVILIKLIVAGLKRASGIKRGIAADLSAKSFFIQSFKIALYVGLAFIIVAILGINVTGAVGIVSAVTVALGLALQDIIGMFASGLLIFNTQNFHTGDYIKVCNSFGSEEGKVVKISLLYTTLLTFDGQKIYIPNNNITKANLTNYSDHIHRRVMINITLTYEADSEQVLKDLVEIASNNENVLKDPAPNAVVSSFRDFGVEYSLRLYVELDKYWDTLYLMQDKVLQLIKEKGYKPATSTLITINKDEK